MSWQDDTMSAIAEAGSAYAAGAATETVKADDRPVYMGPGAGESVDVIWGEKLPRTRRPSGVQLIDADPNIRPPRVAKRSVRTTIFKDDTRLAGEVRGQVLAWHGTDKFDEWGKRLLDLGLIDPGDEISVEILDAVWQDAVDLASRFFDGGAGKKVTPWQAAEFLDTGGSGNGSRYGSSGGAFTGNRSSTSTSVDLTDPATAKAITNDSLSLALGRAARPEELAQFLQVINSAERSSPTVTTSNTRYDKGEAVSQSSTTSGGLTGAGRSQMVLDRAQALPEYGAFQAASTYFNSLVSALDSPV